MELQFGWMDENNQSGYFVNAKNIFEYIWMHVQ